jgi:hypothetical protein
MHAHLYHEGVGKKGANNVASLPMVTVHPASPADFLDYDKLMNYLYPLLAASGDRQEKSHLFLRG